MYINVHTVEVVADRDAYEYAKLNLDSLRSDNKEDFVEWFYSGNWLHKTKEQIKEDREDGIFGLYSEGIDIDNIDD